MQLFWRENVGDDEAVPVEEFITPLLLSIDNTGEAQLPLNLPDAETLIYSDYGAIRIETAERDPNSIDM